MNEMIGIAGIIGSIGILYLLYHLGRFYKNIADIDERYALFEIGILNKKSKLHNLDLNKIKFEVSTLNKIPRADRKNFRETLKDDIKKELTIKLEEKLEV